MCLMRCGDAGVRCRSIEDFPAAKRARFEAVQELRPGRFGGNCSRRPCARSDPGQYKQQKEAWEDAKAQKGADGVAPILPCFRNHHAFSDPRAASVVEKISFGKPLADNFNFVPDGLVFKEAFITPEEEKFVLRQLDEAGGASWECDIQRRVQQYGFKFDHAAGGVLRACDKGMPEWSDFLVERFIAQGLLPDKCNQLIVNEYSPGQGIAMHFDRPCFGERVAVISLLVPITMCWSNEKDRLAEQHGVAIGECVLTRLTRCSCAVFGGSGRSELGGSGKGPRAAARWQWQHGIAKSPLDIDADGKVVRRQRRISLTFRTVDAAAAQRAEQCTPGWQPAAKQVPEPSVEWEQGWRGGYCSARVRLAGRDDLVARCNYAAGTDDNELAVGPVIHPGRQRQVIEFTVDGEKANACVGIASAEAASQAVAPGKLFGAALPRGWGAAYWMDGTAHAIDVDPHPHYLEECGGVHLSGRQKARMRMITTENGIDVLHEGCRGWQKVHHFPMPPHHGPIVPFAYFALNNGESCGFALRFGGMR